MSWSQAQRKYASSPAGKAARQKYQASLKGKATRAAYMARRKAKRADTKQTKVITLNTPETIPEIVKGKKEVKSKK